MKFWDLYSYSLPKVQARWESEVSGRFLEEISIQELLQEMKFWDLYSYILPKVQARKLVSLHLALGEEGVLLKNTSK